jgi:hypothetical protein
MKRLIVSLGAAAMVAVSSVPAVLESSAAHAAPGGAVSVSSADGQRHIAWRFRMSGMYALARPQVGPEAPSTRWTSTATSTRSPLTAT